MDRRRFLRSAAVTAAAAPLLPDAAFATGARRERLPDPSAEPGAGPAPGPVPDDTLVMDAMGELRTIYEPPLIREMLASGMDAITVTLGDPRPTGAEALEIAVDALLKRDRYLEAHPELFVKATSVADVDRARRSGRLAVFYLFQNTVQFGDELDRIDMFYRLGLRSAQLTYNARNRAGSGVEAEGGDRGVTDFGRGLIDRMNEIGMLVDLSHAGMRTMAEAIEHSASPVVVSHTGCAAVHEHIRNTTDANLRLLADHGGVVGVCQIRPFLTDLKEDNLHVYFEHLEHAVDVAGIEHVAIGSDRDHRRIEMTEEYVAELTEELGGVASSALPYFVEGLNGPRRMETIWDGLLERGYSEDDAERIMGGNLYRLYRDVIG